MSASNTYFLKALFSLIKKQRNVVPPSVRTVVIVQNMKMGDMVCTTPLFNALKKHIPGVRVVVCGDLVNEQILVGHPSVDRYIHFDHRNIESTIKNLQMELIDVGMTPGPDALGLAVLALSGSKSIVVPRVVGGKSPYEGRWYKILRRFVKTMPHTMGMYAPREYLRLLEPLAIFTDDTKKTLSVSNDSRKSVDTILGSSELMIGISPSAGNKIKQWPAERFGKVAEYLIRTYNARICVYGSSKEQEEIDAMMKEVITKDRAIVLYPHFNLEGLKAVTERLSLFISSDTGPIYIAEAFGVPTIDIVGPVDEREQPPQGLCHIVLAPDEPRTPQLRVLDARSYDPVEARRQAENVTVERVLEAADNLLKKPQKK